MTTPLTLTDATFEEQILTSGALAATLFWAEWNSTCKAIAPSITELAAEYAGRVLIGRLDVETNPVTAGRLGVSNGNIPSLLFFADGQLQERIVGYRPLDVLRRRLDALMAGAGQ